MKLQYSLKEFLHITLDRSEPKEPVHHQNQEKAANADSNDRIRSEVFLFLTFN